MSELSFEDVFELLHLDTETGKLFWKPRGPHLFSEGGKRGAQGNANFWNRRFAGQEAFTDTNGRGYLRGSIFNRRYRAHRIVWLLHTGKWPADQIDHINGDRMDNRPINLREVDTAGNTRNQTLSRANTSGVCGVHYHKQINRWVAEITVDRKRIFLGSFDDRESAAIVRLAAQERFGFSARHGRPA
ncbi:HNH endonuclease [Neorhizobium sp. CSC1952]|uniref:HNH endonuclease n=1 Tax=Neorhizobium sp. CSC1952 TaxID=2978974 RepID=UPI0025A5DC9C|nr:HNH endonuclease [Rhizobium sp. CSC1952]WJR66977.1 HNH endonuclease [Rhizobium sp. CSC1952]